MISRYVYIQISIKVYIQWTAEVWVRPALKKKPSWPGAVSRNKQKKNFKNMSCIVDGNGWFKNPWLAERSQVTTRWGKKSPTMTMGMTIWSKRDSAWYVSITLITCSHADTLLRSLYNAAFKSLSSCSSQTQDASDTAPAPRWEKKNLQKCEITSAALNVR